MKKINLNISWILIILFLLLCSTPRIHSTSFQQPVIIDHTCTDINQIPEDWIEMAKSNFMISYGHTSHGSQIITGMQALADSDDLYSFNYDGSYGALSIHDREPSGDLGNPNPVDWYYKTRNLLDDPSNDRNLIMWAWCGQVSHASESYIIAYLDFMDQLENDYPNITFVYMTGHLNGTGENGNLHKRNNQIREFCRNNNKILFDFADIESYDPDGSYFLDKFANDNCDYDSDNDGILDSNWAAEWLALYPQDELAILSSQCGSCAHSQKLNCVLKGSAFWWMMALLAGWGRDECDYNQDGIINDQDLIDKRKAVLYEFNEWIIECWNKRNECADINGNGFIDEADKQEKYDSLMKELAVWLTNCGFQKKGTQKR